MRFGFSFVGLGLSLFLLQGCGGGGGSSGDPAPEEPLPFQISGTISIEANSRVDPDSAEQIVERGAPVLSEATELPASVILGGYVSFSAGTYANESGGASEFSYPADPVDEYSINLEPGQSVFVQIFPSPVRQSFPPEAPRTSLTLLDGDRVVDDASGFAITDTAKRVTLPATGEPAGVYTVRLEALEDGAPLRYLLTSSALGSGVQAEWMPHDFVPGQALVKQSQAAFQASQFVAPKAAMAQTRSLGAGLHLAQMPQTLTAGGMAAPLTVEAHKTATLEWIRALRERPDIESAHPNYRMSATGFPTSQNLFSRQWHYPLINLPTAWQLTQTTASSEGGQGVRIAVLDTGVFFNGTDWHEDLAPNIVNCDSAPLAGCFDAIDGGFPVDPGTSTGGSVFHGTHVAGTASAAALASPDNVGGSGVAYNSTLVPVRVLDGGGSGSSADLIEGINWVTNEGQPTTKADIINLSLGGLPELSSVQSAINAAVNRGIIVVGASGNGARNLVDFPAAHDNVFAVGAVDGAANVSSYSNTGSRLDLVAPGGDATRDANGDGIADLIISTSGDALSDPPQDRYIGLQGTSMAAPHVAGVFALMKAVDASVNTSTLEFLLSDDSGELQLTEDLGEPGRDNTYGWGLLDAAKAVEAVSSGLPALLVASPSVLDFQGDTTQLTVTLEQTQSGDVSSPTFSVPVSWLEVAEVDSGSTESYAYEVTLDRSQLDSDKAFRTTIAFDYTDSEGQARTLDLPVTVSLESPENLRNAGAHFVLLLDPQTQETLAQVKVTASSGTYRFAFTEENGVGPGEYLLIAGTDLDNDGIICSAGEACAEYPISGLREKITADEEGRRGLDMTTAFNRPVSAESLPRPGFKGYKLLRDPEPAKERKIDQ